jgi:hypothetical protein
MVKKLLTYGTPKRLHVAGSPKKLRSGEAGCVCCLCNQCTGATPYQIQATISGVVNYICSDCQRYNGTFVCTRLQGNPCRWEYEISPDICAGFGIGGRGFWILTVDLGYVAGTITVTWRETVGSSIVWRASSVLPISCAFDSYSVPFLLNQYGCQGTPTCHLTAL